MNSRQRRKDTRAWKYCITMTNKTYNEYCDMWNWLRQRYGGKVHWCGWRDRVEETNYFYYNIEWQFLKQKDAVEFALRWA